MIKKANLAKYVENSTPLTRNQSDTKYISRRPFHVTAMFNWQSVPNCGKPGR